MRDVQFIGENFVPKFETTSAFIGRDLVRSLIDRVPDGRLGADGGFVGDLLCVS